LSYTHRKSAGQSGTNRITQAEISSEFWRSFPVQVNAIRNHTEKIDATSLHRLSTPPLLSMTESHSASDTSPQFYRFIEIICPISID